MGPYFDEGDLNKLRILTKIFSQILNCFVSMDSEQLGFSSPLVMETKCINHNCGSL